jgi:septal ring factor EnvC (AmiA/AmiB activator)
MAVVVATGSGSMSIAGQTPPGSARAGALTGRAHEQLRALHDEADRLVLKERTVLRQLRALELAKQIAAEERRAFDADVVAATSAVEATDAQILQIEHERDRERPLLETRLVDVYKLGKGRYARLLLSTAHVERIGRASRAVSALAARDQAQLTKFQGRLVALARARAALEEQRRELDLRRQKAVSAEAAAARAIEARNALVRDIGGQRDLNARLAGELETARLRLETAVADTSGSAAPVRMPIGPFRGALPWPVALRTGQSTTPAWHKSPSRNGIEVVADEGTPVQAVHDGTVTFAGSFEGFGNLVIVDHGERAYSLYGDLVEMSVGRGVQVDRGSPIGRTGATPAGDPGLYFELRVDARPVDPIHWLNRVTSP